VLIDAFEVPDDMVVRWSARRGRWARWPLVQTHRTRIARELARGAQEEALEVQSRIQLAQMKSMQAISPCAAGRERDGDERCAVRTRLKLGFQEDEGRCSTGA